MRDPKRIDKVLDLIKGVWKQHPDLRLMQLLLNALPSKDQYFTEDDSLEYYIKEEYGGKKIEYYKPKL